MKGKLCDWMMRTTIRAAILTGRMCSFVYHAKKSFKKNSYEAPEIKEMYFVEEIPLLTEAISDLEEALLEHIVV